MHYTEIAEKIVSEGLRTSVGATPPSTVNAVLTTSINAEGDESPFQKTETGTYMLRSSVTKPNKTSSKLAVSSKESEDEESEAQYSIITSFGMYWQREKVDWTSSPKLLGMQQLGAEAVDFANQIGIYLLYDGREVIYVGRATDQPIGKRLYAHTADRLSTRWDRFSWFGARAVSDKGALEKPPSEYLASKMLPAFEAVLIEALEPRQNRRRGDDLAAVEFLQKEDPAILRKQKKAFLEAALEKV